MPSPAVDAAFAQFWAAADAQEAAKAIEAVVTSGVSFEAAMDRLKRGRTYSRQAPRGVVLLSHRTKTGEFWYGVDIPDTYDAARPYQVRVQLHGGVMMRETGVPRGPASVGALTGAEQIYVIPYGWRDAPWWSDAQIESVRIILDDVKRTYNVDENRVALAGVSDGATGAYYFAMRDPTPFSSFLPLNGFIMVLRSLSGEIDGGLFPNNLLNKPFFVVNGGMDRLYPSELVEPYVLHLKRGGVETVYRPQPNGAHNTAWWPEMKEPFETFVAQHPRDPVPAKLTWETDDTTARNRVHWLIIDKLGGSRSTVTLPDLNDSTTVSVSPLFRNPRPSGRVDLIREGNTVRATTRGVAEFTLLLSPGAFDFARPIKVVADGRTVFDDRVTASVATLMKWAARDNDRTMLFGAEIHVRLTE
jgi:hypothetical protein